eukprot:TRINITY_DN4035_c0_g1_i1.p1 TRINITY_DN4035_c0_g1~~TRINITY_DN4035_c0_g1_i1.p1  ORF type:complete len:470 (-),score=120.70 TRINITY_DN4035_c0_g1_i1:227-1636(-)
MASPNSTSVSALQVGSYFVGQYYQVLQHQPHLVHQFYADLSVMQRRDQTAKGMREIHDHIMSLDYTGSVIEIKSADAQQSLSGGILVMVTGSIQRKDIEFRKSFVQTFFLAPQDTGYYVLNDIFRYNDNDEDDYPQNRAEFTTKEDLQNHTECTANGNHDLQSNAALTVPDSVEASDVVSRVVRDEEVETKEFDNADHHEVSVMEDHDKSSTEIPVVATSTAVKPEVLAASLAPSSSVPVEENPVEPTKHTYASILRASKGPSVTAAPHHIPPVKPVPVASSQPSTHTPSANMEQMQANSTEHSSVSEIEGEGGSIYVRNLPSTVTSSDLELEFQRYGKIRLGGITVVNKKEARSCFAFIEFEDSASVQNAVGASPLTFGGRQIHIEEKRNAGGGSRGRRGGRGRGFQNDGTRGRGSGGRGTGRGGLDSDRAHSTSGRGSGGQGAIGSTGNTRQSRRATGNQALQNGAN